MKANILIGIVILLLIGVVFLVIRRIRTSQEVRKIWRLCATQHSASTQQYFTEEMIAGLPAPTQRYFLHAIAPGTLLPTSVTLDMQGQFRLGKDKPWLAMQAQEILTSQGFVWLANIGRGLLQGGDYYINGLGGVQFSLWGLLPVANIHNQDTARASIGRLACEFLWLPSALLPQHGVEWAAIANNTIQASLKIDDQPVTLTLVIDADGKLLEISLPRWSNYTEDGTWAYIPFGGKCQAEKTFGGLTIPYQVNVGWWFGKDNYFDFFQATIQQVEFDHRQ
ncbi:hypothetical protein Nos7524_2287 [Nostoc sp. PCC 7524]|uniref:DUF6920 family protein n=1 Tax=Nostoc sp. (strain ATCC 29411 / PCC 7524) TaxID=28072 RepID=UPI00029F3035|nr:DUF6544 family protein [Nostoc sp. PCC 7524]AFY48130.1 hypothetical protein Nos7524_2287 [Nostoc sp. PCC 7524]